MDRTVLNNEEAFWVDLGALFDGASSTLGRRKQSVSSLNLCPVSQVATVNPSTHLINEREAIILMSESNDPTQKTLPQR